MKDSFDWKASHAQQTRRLVKAIAAIKGLLEYYRTEGCTDPQCRICQRSREAEAAAREVLKG